MLTAEQTAIQTRAIHRQQRRRQTLHGLLDERDRQRIRKVHQDAQRLLRPLLVANPFADRLTFLDTRTRTRRDHLKYLTLIRTIALLHQYSRPVKQVRSRGKSIRYIEVIVEDIALANRLAREVLGRSLDDLPPQTRRLLVMLDEMVNAACRRHGIARCDVRFTRRDVRAFTGWSDFQVRVHLDRLVSLEYVLVHRGGRGQSFVYELLYDARAEETPAYMSGLVDAERLRLGTAPGAGESSYCRVEGSHTDFRAGSSPHRAPIEGGSRGGTITPTPEPSPGYEKNQQN